MLPTKFQVNLPFCSGVEAKNGFQDGGHLGFSMERVELFLIYKSPKCFLQSFKSVGLSVEEKKGK